MIPSGPRTEATRQMSSYWPMLPTSDALHTDEQRCHTRLHRRVGRGEDAPAVHVLRSLLSSVLTDPLEIGSVSRRRYGWHAAGDNLAPSRTAPGQAPEHERMTTQQQ